jgi:RNA polymerase subunit RPABC4/transcription elongation factor Spt4
MNYVEIDVKLPLDELNFNTLMESVFHGMVSPYDVDGDETLPDMWTFPDETIRWVGNVSSDRALYGLDSGGKGGSVDVYVGVSPYRIVFSRDTVGLVLAKRHFVKSYWFNVDFEGFKWERFRRNKPFYITSFRMKTPDYKKSIGSKTIRIMYSATQEAGKTLEFLGNWNYLEIMSLKWIDPATGQKERGKADLLYADLMEAFNNQCPVTISELGYLSQGVGQLEAHLSEGQAAHKPAGKVVRAAPKKAAAAPVVVKKPEAKTPSAASAAALTCPKCSEQVQAGWKVCPYCGDALPMLCANCGQVQEQDWKLCPFCGNQH